MRRLVGREAFESCAKSQSNAIVIAGGSGVPSYIGGAMRKLAPKHVAFLVRRSIEGNRQQTRRGRRVQRLDEARRDFRALRESLPDLQITPGGRPGYVSFDPPGHFSLYENFEATWAFLLDLREITTVSKHLVVKGERVPFYANLAAIERIDAASGLVLAAEVDRWSRMRYGPIITHDHLWEPQVSDFFHHAGLFDLLRLDPETKPSSAAGPSEIPLKYQTGTIVEGESADELRQALEKLCGQSIGPRRNVYDALSEAMTNVAHHAYPPDVKRWPWVPVRRWWMGGSWSPEEKRVKVQMYDQGVGIPRTLPKSSHWTEVLPILGRIDRERTDAGMIEAAMDYGRTSTGEIGRGKGLAQMAEWTRTTGKGALTIMSGQGVVSFLPGRNPVRRHLPTEFRGTLVEWEVCLDG